MIKRLVVLIVLIVLTGCSSNETPVIKKATSSVISIPTTIVYEPGQVVKFNNSGPHVFGIKTLVGDKYMIETMKLDDRMVFHLTQNYPSLTFPVDIILDDG